MRGKVVDFFSFLGFGIVLLKRETEQGEFLLMKKIVFTRGGWCV